MRTKENRGVTLIALVITIIVLLVLAGISIGTLLGNSGIISKTQDAKKETEIASLEEKIDQVIIEVEGEKNNPTIDDIIEELIKKDIISSSNDVDKKTGTITTKDPSYEIANKLSDYIKTDATSIASEPETYYGKTVDYTSKNGQTGWKIFHADKETNTIYLIASTYIDLSLVPEPINADGTKGTKPANTDTSYPKGASLSNVFSSYSTGSARVTDSKIKKLNNEFFNVKNLTSTDDNMKAVAYLLDTKAWESFKDTSGKADYVIGGPTLELLFDSYNTRYYSGDKQYQYQAVESGTTNSQGTVSSNGYQISSDKGTTWKFYQNTSTEYLKTKNDLYAVTRSTDSRSMGLLGSFALCF